MNKIRVAICDDLEFLCQNLQNHFKYQEDIEFVGYCTSAKECPKLVKDSCPDVLLLDIQMEKETAGIDIISELLEENPKLKIIIMSSFAYNEYIFSALINGATDYVTKDCSVEQIIQKIHDAYLNQTQLLPEISQKFTDMSRTLNESHQSLIYMLSILITLSKTEFEILKLACAGKSNDAIAKLRFTEVSTVRSMCSNILKKFGATNMKNLVNSINNLHVFDHFKNLDK